MASASPCAVLRRTEDCLISHVLDRPDQLDFDRVTGCNRELIHDSPVPHSTTAAQAPDGKSSRTGAAPTRFARRATRSTLPAASCGSLRATCPVSNSTSGWRIEWRGSPFRRPHRTFCASHTAITLTISLWIPRPRYHSSRPAFPSRIRTRPVRREMHYEAWTTVAGVHFPTRRVNYLEGLKLGEITGSAIRINIGLSPEQLGRQPSDFMPDVPRP